MSYLLLFDHYEEEETANLIECADCRYGFIPENFKQTICDDCFENRQLWLEMDENK